MQEVREDDADAQAKLNFLLQLKRTDSMYLLVLPTDLPTVLCNVIDFDGICQIRSSDLILAGRLASLSLAVWPIFASFSRMVLARANPRECAMRFAFEEKSI